MDAIESAARARVLAAARSWIGTQFHDCASIKGVGVDCAQLIKAVYEQAGLVAPFDLPHYSPQWFLHQEAEAFLAHIDERAIGIDQAQSKPGDIVMYRFGRCFSHAAIVDEPGFPAIIHAYKNARGVVTGEGDQGDLAEIGSSEAEGKIGKPRPRRFFTLKSWAPA